MTPKIRKIYKQFVFYTIKLPLIYIAIPVGFVFEYLITFPYIVLCTLDSMSKTDSLSKTDSPSKKDSLAEKNYQPPPKPSKKKK